MIFEWIAKGAWDSRPRITRGSAELPNRSVIQSRFESVLDMWAMLGVTIKTLSS
jgi:hypothetical protein